MKKFKLFAFSILVGLFMITGVNAQEVGTISELEECILVDNNICTLNDDIKIGEFTGAKFTIASGKTITIDLNGYTISGKNSDENVSSSIITNKGTLIINDSSSAKTGKMEMDDTRVKLQRWAYGMFVISNGGTLTINGGLLENKGATDVPYAIDNNSTTGNLLLTVNGGTLKGVIAVRAFANSTTYENKIVVNGGLLEGTSSGVWLQQSNGNAQKASLVVNDGKIIGGNYPALMVDMNNNENSSVVNVTINGGEFRNNDDKYETISYFPLSGSSLANAVINLTIKDGLFVSENPDMGVLSLNNEDGINTDNIIITGGRYSHSIDAEYITAPYVTEKNGDYYVLVLDKEEVSSDSTEVDTETEVEEVTAGVAEADKEEVNDVLLDSLGKDGLVAGETGEIEVKLEITTENVSEEAKEEIEEAMEEENLTIVEFFDANVNVYVDGKVVGNLEELTGEVKLTVMLPNELQECEEGYKRVFYIIRRHGNEVEKLEAKLSEDGTYLNVGTDKFSTYAIAYEDVEDITPPKTGDNIVTTIAICLMSIVALAALGLFLKKHYN